MAGEFSATPNGKTIIMKKKVPRSSSKSKLPLLAVHFSNSPQLATEDPEETSQVTFDYSLGSSIVSDRTTSATFDYKHDLPDSPTRIDYGFGKYMSGSEHSSSLDSKTRNSRHQRNPCLKRNRGTCAVVDFLTPATDSQSAKDNKPASVKPLYSDDSDEENTVTNTDEGSSDYNHGSEDDETEEEKQEKQDQFTDLRNNSRDLRNIIRVSHARAAFRREPSDYSFAVDSFNSIPEDGVLHAPIPATTTDQQLQATLDKKRELLKSLYDDDKSCASNSSNVSNGGKDPGPTPKLYDDDASMASFTHIQGGTPPSFKPPQPLEENVVQQQDQQDYCKSSFDMSEEISYYPSLVDLSPSELQKQLLDAEKLKKSPTPKDGDIILPALFDKKKNGIQNCIPQAPLYKAPQKEFQLDDTESGTFATSDSTTMSTSSYNDSSASHSSSTGCTSQATAKGSFCYPAPVISSPTKSSSKSSKSPTKSPTKAPRARQPEEPACQQPIYNSYKVPLQDAPSSPVRSPKRRSQRNVGKGNCASPTRSKSFSINRNTSTVANNVQRSRSFSNETVSTASTASISEDEVVVYYGDEEDSAKNVPLLPHHQQKHAARLAKAKERIRLRQIEQEQQEHEERVLAEGTAQLRRLEAAYQWYTRCGYPTKSEFYARVQKMPTSCGISVADVDLLPWTEGNSFVDPSKVKAFLTI